MTTELMEKPVNTFSVGTLPKDAQEIYAYVKDALVAKAAPLKEQSIAIADEAAMLPPKWEDWTQEEAAEASAIYDRIGAHTKTITNKSKQTELDAIADKAHKLHKGIVAAIKDVQGALPEQYEALKEGIRKWRNREEARAAEAARKAQEAARKAEEEARLAEALRLEEEAAKLAAANPVAAQEMQAEAEAIVSAPAPFIPPAPVATNIPKGGPRNQKYMKFQVTDFAKLPDTFKIANEQMIRATVNAQRMSTQIPGVKVWEE